MTRRQFIGVSAAVVLTAVLLLGIGVTDYTTGRKIHQPRSSSSDTLHVRLIGHQWWWEVQYEEKTPPYRITTANEIHVPVGRPVVLTLESRDVIHSFWAPNLHGKTDLIPSYAGQMLIQADTPGVFRAPCAEFCGDQHAKMALLVIAQPLANFETWFENESANAVEPEDAMAAQGRDVFLHSSCTFCHTIRGTPSGGTVAPDLTHLAGRQTLAAGTIPNRRGYLGGWIVNSQSIKPGNHMPPNILSGHDLEALLDYLVTLR